VVSVGSTFLLEIGTEEIPARFMKPALAQLREAAAAELAALRLAHGRVEVLGTPRRLAVLVSGLEAVQDDLLEKKKGPARKAAFGEDGEPTSAAAGFARGQGVSVAELVTEAVDGVEYVFALKKITGRPASEVLPAACERIVNSLSFPKPMFWAGREVRFARPVRWLAALYGNEVVPFTFAGLTSGRETFGHRFLAPGPFALDTAGDYPSVLAEGKVIADPEERQELIRQQVNEAAAGVGGRPGADENLLEEVTFLVEFPRAVTGTFNPQYLEIPAEVLVTVMRVHQRYFPVYSAEGRLLPAFVAVSNGTAVQYLPNVRTGNERVLGARLADARFFFDEDRKKPLAGFVTDLESIMFLEQLGSMRDKTERLVKIVAGLAEAAGLSADMARTAARAAALCKADLATQMVYEFPELQGIMGGHYALLSGEEREVAAAITRHYAPRHAGDRPAESLPGAVVAVADKLDTLVSCFGLGLIPSGSQDPYALRRSALGVVSTLLEHKMNIPLERLVALALPGLAGRIKRPAAETAAEVIDFLRQRVRFLLGEAGFRYDVVEAVLGGGGDDLPGLYARASVLQEKLDTPELTRLLTPYTRAANLARNLKDGARPDPALFSSEAERKLHEATAAARAESDKAEGEPGYQAAFASLSRLYLPIENFFNEVMVMVEDEAVRRNRLALLWQVKEAFLVLGDLSRIVQ
jgi:glycyl-tRNA synthetase beta chain